MVGVATYSGHAYCRKEFIQNTRKLVEFSRRMGIETHVYVLWNGGKFPKGVFPFDWVVEKMDDTGLRGIDILEKKHNQIRQRVLDRNYDHLFMLESDTFPPENTIYKFIATGQKIVTAVYFIKGEEKLLMKIPNTQAYKDLYGQYAGREMFVIKQDRIPSLWILDGKNSRLATIDDVIPQRGLIKVLSSGVGSVLIAREVLEKIAFKIQDGDIKQFTDFLFYKEAYDLGYETYADTGCFAGHIHPVDEVADAKKWFNAETLEKVHAPARH